MLKRNTSLSALVAGAAFMMAMTPEASARDQINIVGSSTVFPFATTVADKFGKKTDFKTPKIVSTGSGGGMKLFCKGVGENTPDITNASRRMKASEWKKCQAAGVKSITEVMIGFDGIVIANTKDAPTIELTRKQLYLALGAMIPGPDGKLIKNPNTKWSDIDPSLPATKIEVLGPPPSSGTRDAFEEIGLEKGCRKFDWVAKLRKMKKGDAGIKEMADKYSIPADFLMKKGKPTKGKNIVKKICRHIREDGPFIDAGENDNKIVDQLSANPNAFGIFGFSFLDQNKAKIKGAKIKGVEPSFDNIAAGDYPISRSMYFYVKNAHVNIIPGIKEFVSEFVSEDAVGEDGYLLDKGLIPLSEDVAEKMAEHATNLVRMTGQEELY